VQAYARLGLTDAARRLLKEAPLDPAVRQALSAALPAGESRLAWSQFDAQFRRNLDVFEKRTGLSAVLLASWREVRGGLRLYQAGDGNYQVWSNLPWARGWLPAFQPHDRLCDREALRAQWQGSVIRTLALSGVGLGRVPLDLYQASQQTHLLYSAPLIVIEPSLLAWAVVLHLHDWAQMLADPRVTLCAGAEAMHQLKSELENRERLVPCVIDPKSRWPGSLPYSELVELAAAAELRRREQQDRQHAALCRAYESRDQAYWASRFATTDGGAAAKPLTIVAVTSRYTTVLQYSLRDLLAAFERLGHRTFLFHEADEHSHFSPLRLIELMQAEQPDLVITADHLRVGYPRLFPENLPGVCWIQDRLPHLFDVIAGPNVRPLEFVIGYGFPELVTEYGYPAARFMPCQFATNPEQLLDPHETPADLAPYECDVMYAANMTVSPDEARERLCRRFGEVSRPLAEAAYALLLEAVHALWFCGDYDYGKVLRAAEKATGRHVDNASDRGVVVSDLRNIADLYLRLNTARAAARWAEARGGRLHLYGHGWERWPEFAEYARGFVKHGPELGRAFRAARICLHAGCNPALHQRVLDGLCAGGFFLIREKPSDTDQDVSTAVYRRVQALNPALPYRLRPEELPEPLATRCRESIRRRGDDPAKGILLTRAHLDHARAYVETRHLYRASGLWPNYGRIVFRDGAQLAERIDYFLDHADERRELAGQMRAAVLEHFTHDALARRVLSFLREYLASGPGHAGRIAHGCSR